MNDKDLQKKLDKKTQDLISNVKCKTCGFEVVYILRGKGGDRLYYDMCEPEKVLVVEQSGQSHIGYPLHEHD